MAGSRGRGDFRRMGFQPRLCALLLLHCHQPSRLHKSHSRSSFSRTLYHAQQPSAERGQACRRPFSYIIEALAKPLDAGVAQVSFALRLGHDQAKRPCDRRQRRDAGLSVWDLNRSGRLQAWHGWRSGRNRRQGSLSRRLVRRGA